jgi:hypothetical protein
MRVSTDVNGMGTLDRGCAERIATAPPDALDAPPGGLAERIACRTKEHHPVTVAALIGVVWFVVMGAILVGLGLLLTHVLLSGGLGRWDERVNDWFVIRRTSAWNSITSFGTSIGSTGTVVAVAAVTTLVEEGRLRVTVEDDGAGGADIDHGTGLRGLDDRVAALGGTMTVESPAGRGTRIVAELPCAS